MKCYVRFNSIWRFGIQCVSLQFPLGEIIIEIMKKKKEKIMKLLRHLICFLWNEVVFRFRLPRSSFQGLQKILRKSYSPTYEPMDTTFSLNVRSVTIWSSTFLLQKVGEILSYQQSIRKRRLGLTTQARLTFNWRKSLWNFNPERAAITPHPHHHPLNAVTCESPSLFSLDSWKIDSGLRTIGNNVAMKDESTG